MKVLIDNGHGKDTAGKRSPNGALQEWQYTREVAMMLVDALKRDGIDAEQLVPEERDISLSERCNRVNDWCAKLGKEHVLLVSIHLNAAGSGKEWMRGRGWEAYTYKGQSASDVLAEYLYKAARLALPESVLLRMDKTDGDSDKEARYYVLKHTACPAVLTENLFMDNKEEYEYLLSKEGRRSIMLLHKWGIEEYIESLSNNR